MITFIDHIIYGKVLNAFNNNIVRFKDDSGRKPVNADITVSAGAATQQRATLPGGGTLSFQITPSPQWEFYYNLSAVAQKLINAARFADNCPYPAVASLYHDQEAHIELEVQYKINFDDLTFEKSAKSYHFVKGAHQIKNKGLQSFSNRYFPLHTPTGNREVHLTYWKWYPFDFALYAHDPELTINYSGSGDPRGTNVWNETFMAEKGVHRFIICNGPQQFEHIDSNLHLIEFEDWYINLHVRDECDGVYLKWHNQYGGWDYWLFDRNYLDTFKDKALGVIDNDIDNLYPTISPEVSLGKIAQRSMKLFANQVPDYEVERLLGISTSPKVYMYMRKRGEVHHSLYWNEVQVKGSSHHLHSQSTNHVISINITLPEPYTLTL